MSVLACARSGCDNIMCDHYSYEHGYICNSCLSELQAFPNVDIGYFMTTEPMTNPPNDDWRNYVLEIFQDGE